MSRRAVRLVLQRLPSTIIRPRLLPRRLLSLPRQPLLQPRWPQRALPSIRAYATQAPGPDDEDSPENYLAQLTPAERERNALHQKAQYPHRPLSWLMHREYLEAQRFDEVEKVYNQLLARDDLTPHEILFVNYNLGLLNHQQGDTQKAGKFWEEGLAVVDQIGTAAEEKGIVVATTMNLGTLYVVNGKPEEGLKHLELAAKMEPNDGEIRFNLASALASMGNYIEALREFRAAESMGVTSTQEPIEKLKEIIAEHHRKEGGRE
jgi:tetratricopeptide (TPR) repeat protein